MIEIIDTKSGWCSKKTIWDNFVSQQNASHPFTGHDWLYSWWECFEDGQLKIIFVNKNNKLVAIAPLFIDHKGVLRFIGEGESDYCEFILDKNQDSFELINYVLQYMIERFKIKRIRLEGIIRREQLICVKKSLEKSHSVFVKKKNHCYMSEMMDYEIYKSTISRNLLKSSRNTWNRIQRGLPGFKFNTVDDVSKEWIDNFIDLHIKRWKSKNIESKYKKTNYRSFIKKIVEKYNKNGLIAYEILDNSELMAAELCFIINNTQNHYLAVVNNDYLQYSAGSYLNYLVLQNTVNRYNIDFLRGAENYKKRWLSKYRILWQIDAYPKSFSGLFNLSARLCYEVLKLSVNCIKNYFALN